MTEKDVMIKTEKAETAEHYPDNTTECFQGIKAENRSGKVWLVGAGPSDPGLFTLKGMQVLQNAEVVVYDALVGQGIMSMIPDEAEAIDVGKRASHHTLSQDKINELLVEKAKEGKRVVRLKGGDPFLFGRGGEEIERLVQEEIPFEVVPGVTSALAVPAYQGIPVTHRDFCSSVHIITGHKRADQQPSLSPYDKDCASDSKTLQEQERFLLQSDRKKGVDIGNADSSVTIDFEALVRTKGTLVFLMGVSALPEICRGLLNAGMEPGTPAALLMRGTTAGQRKIVATVETLEEEAKRQGACTPAIIVIGDVCTLAEPFSWYEKQPLGGVKVLLTRPKERIGETASKLRALGAEVLELPAIRTERIPNNERLSKALAKLSSYQWIVFTSPTGVRVFFEEMAEHGIDCRALGAARFAVIGNGTKKALAERGFYADLIPEVFDAAHLGKALRKAIEKEMEADGRGDGSAANGCVAPKQAIDCQVTSGNVSDEKRKTRILVPRAAIGSPELLRELGDAYLVDDIPTYETMYESSRFVDLQQEFAEKKIDYVVFTSGSTARDFAAAVPGIDYTKVQAVCIGKQTAAEADNLGMKTFVAEQASIDSLIQCLMETAISNVTN